MGTATGDRRGVEVSWNNVAAISDELAKALDDRSRYCPATYAAFNYIMRGADPLETITRLALNLGKQSDEAKKIATDICEKVAIPITLKQR